MASGKKIKITTQEWDSITNRYMNFFGLRFQSDLAKLLGISKEGLTQFRPRGSLPYDKLIRIGLENKANLNWLFTGRGEMGSDHNLQDENERLRTEIIKKDAIIEYQKEQIEELS